MGADYRSRKSNSTLGACVGPFRRLEVRGLAEAEPIRDDRRRKHAPRGVVALSDFVEALALDGDAVLGPGELVLELEEVRVRFELRISLHHHHEPAQGAGKLVLSLLVSRERFGVGQVLRRDLDRGRLRARLDHFGQRLAFEVRGPLHRLHQVRNEIRPPLIRILDLRPGGLDALVETDQPVIDAGAPEKETAGYDEKNEKDSTTPE